MSRVMHRWPAAARPAADADFEWRAPPQAIHRLLDAVAAFHDSRQQALRAARELELVHRLLPEQIVLLGPSDASWLRFLRQARQWNRRPHVPDAGRWRAMAMAAGLGALLGAVAMLLGQPFSGPEMTWVAVAMAGASTAIGGAGLVGLFWRQQVQYRSFDRRVRRELGAGRWVVLVHDLAWRQQVGVLSVIGRPGLDWCAVTSAMRAY